jgi:hypothetical protein
MELGQGVVAGPLSIRDLSGLIDGLPAAERAALAWAPAALQLEIGPLASGPLTSDTVVAATAGVFRILGQLLPAAAKLMGAEHFAAQVDGAYQGELDRLRAFLQDAGARRSAEWVFRSLQSFFKLFSQIPTNELAAVGTQAVGDAEFAEALRNDDAGILRGMVLIMAAMSIVDQAGDGEWAAELCDLAFLEASHGVDSLAGAGLPFLPEPDSSSAESRRQILETVEDARTALTAEDLDSLSGARFRDLR